MLAFKGISMVSRDHDIIDCVNQLGTDDRERLIEFIGVRDVNPDEIDAALAAHAKEKNGTSAG